MNIAYLINRYPAISHTFIRREIAGLEALGQVVQRFSIRSGGNVFVDADDSRELTKTSVVLEQNKLALLLAGLVRPLQLFAAWRKAGRFAPMTPAGQIRRIAYAVEALWLGRQLQAAEIQHLHAHFGTNPAAVALLASQTTGISFSFTVHGPDEFDEPRQLDLASKIAAARFVVAISSFGRSQLWRWSDPMHWPKIHVIGCGVPLTTPLPDERQQFELCAVARLAPQKGLHVLIDALRQLKLEGFEPRVAIVGDGPMRSTLEAAASAAGVGGQVHFLGNRSNLEVAQIMRASKLFVLPSFAEGLPVVIMEALAQERPVISTMIAGIPELVDESCGWLVPAGSVRHLCEAIRVALETPEATLVAMGQEGRRRVRERHDATTNAARLLDLIKTAPC